MYSSSKAVILSRWGEIVSFTVPSNIRSIRVMEKIGLKRDSDGNFAHPKFTVDHPLSQHILYRLDRDDYLKENDHDWKTCLWVN